MKVLVANRTTILSFVVIQNRIDSDPDMIFIPSNLVDIIQHLGFQIYFPHAYKQYIPTVPVYLKRFC